MSCSSSSHVVPGVWRLVPIQNKSWIHTTIPSLSPPTSLFPLSLALIQHDPSNIKGIVQVSGNRLTSSRISQPFQSRPCSARRCRGSGFVVRAEEEKRDPSKAPLISSKQIGSIPYLEDNESFTDLMAFKGPAPEARPKPLNSMEDFGWKRYYLSGWR